MASANGETFVPPAVTKTQQGQLILLLIAVVVAGFGIKGEDVYMEGGGSILAWAFFYDLLLFKLKRTGPWMNSAPLGTEELRATSFLGIIHQLGINVVLWYKMGAGLF